MKEFYLLFFTNFIRCAILEKSEIKAEDRQMDLLELRGMLDGIDRQIVELYEERIIAACEYAPSAP